MISFKQLLTLPFLILVVTNAFAQSPQDADAYFKKPSVVGIIIVSAIAYDERVKTGPSNNSYFGGIGAATSTLSNQSHNTHFHYGKYDSALASIDPYINPSKRLSDLYLSLYTEKGKTVIPLALQLDERELEYFMKPSDSRKNYFEKDLRFLREQYNIDELLIVKMEYGVYVYKSYVTRNLERLRFGYARAKSLLIDLHDNSIVIKTSVSENVKLTKAWNTPPNYELLKSTVKTAIDVTITEQSNQYDWKSVKEEKKKKDVYDPIY